MGMVKYTQKIILQLYCETLRNFKKGNVSGMAWWIALIFLHV